jgi:hypothetical protein
MYEDDGKSCASKGAWTGIEFTWHDTSRRLTMRLAKGSRLLPPTRWPVQIRLAGAKTSRNRHAKSLSKAANWS